VTRPLLKFFSLTFVVAWICWTGAAAISQRGAPVDPALATLVGGLILLGTFSPGLIALALTERAEGRAGMSALFRQIFRWQVSPRWYVFAIVDIPAVDCSRVLPDSNAPDSLAGVRRRQSHGIGTACRLRPTPRVITEMRFTSRLFTHSKNIAAAVAVASPMISDSGVNQNDIDE
jgi:hypothetical protein